MALRAISVRLRRLLYPSLELPGIRVRFKVMRCRFGLIRFGTEQTDGWRGYDR